MTSSSRCAVRKARPRSLLRVAQDDRVAVGLDHPNRVGERLPLLDRGALRAAETHDPPAQARHRALEREPRPRRGLIEQRREDLPFQGFGPTTARRDGHHLLRGLQDEFDVRPRQVANREDVASLEAGHQAPYSEVQLKGYPRGPRSIGTALGLRAAPRSRLRILPAQLGDVRGQDHDAAFGFHVPLPVRRVLLRLLRALDRDCGDDLPHDLVDVDAENLAEQVLHAFAVHVSAAIRRPLYEKIVNRLNGETVPPASDGRALEALSRPGESRRSAGDTAPSKIRIKEAGRGVLGPACGLWRRGYWVGVGEGVWNAGSMTSTAFQSPPKSFVIPVASWNRTRRRPFSKKM